MIQALRNLFGEGGDAPPALSVASTEEIVNVLGNYRRRYVLEILSENGGSMELNPLAREVAARENGADAVEMGSEDYKRTYVTLYQNHLPQMDAAGVIETERKSTVHLGPDFDSAVWLLEQVKRLEGE